jgi:hypothetical protein
MLVRVNSANVDWNPRLFVSILGLGILTIPVFGARWSEVSTGLTGPAAHVSSLAVAAGGSTLYVRTTGSSIFRSRDAGATWKAVGGVSGVLAVVTDPQSDSVIYAGTIRGVFRSVDAGESWTSEGLAGRSVSILAVDPQSPSTVYAKVYADRRDQIYKTSDAGATWSLLSLVPTEYPPVSSILIDPLTPSTVYVLAARPPGVSNVPTPGGLTVLYKSTDAGETWNVIDPGPFVSPFVIDPMMSALYAVRAPAGLSRSTDDQKK